MMEKLFVTILLLLFTTGAWASWLSDFTGINLDPLDRNSEEKLREIDQIIAKRLSEIGAPESVLQTGWATIAQVLYRLGVAYSIERVGANLYVATEYHDLGFVRPYLVGRVRVFLIPCTEQSGVCLRPEWQEQRVKSDLWKLTTDEEIRKSAEPFVAEIRLQLERK